MGIHFYSAIILMDPITDMLIGTILLAFENKSQSPDIGFLKSFANITSAALNRRNSESQLTRKGEDVPNADRFFKRRHNPSGKKTEQFWHGIKAPRFYSASERRTLLENLFRTVNWETYDLNGKKISGEQHPSMQTLRTGKPVKDFIMLVKNGADENWIKINTQPVFFNGNAEPDQVVITFSNISGLMALEDQLRITIEQRNNPSE